MDLNTFIVAVFCLIDDRIEDRALRARGPLPRLSDAEVLTLEIVGEFLGLDTDKAIFRYFRRHYGEWFPALGEVHRTTFARQAANLWKIKERLWQELLGLTPHDPAFAICDSMPLPACSFARAHRCKRFKGEAAFGKSTRLNFSEHRKAEVQLRRMHLLGTWVNKGKKRKGRSVASPARCTRDLSRAFG